MVKNENQQRKFNRFLLSYIKIKVDRFTINCPYWSNKLKLGRVVLRGFQNGKGKAQEITAEINRLYFINKSNIGTIDDLSKLIKAHKIGIDCSGFAFRLIDKLIKSGYQNCPLNNILQIYPQGINKTNSDSLTSATHLVKINRLNEVQMGDLIRLNGGKHILIITENTGEEITYVHSSRLTKIQGVHFGRIKILQPHFGLDRQLWKEMTKTGENFGERYYKEEFGDGIFRLKIFA